MTKLTLDPHYSDSYSGCGSSNSSFSYGLPTPTSSADFSAATSRRQSIASESQSNGENSAGTGSVPTFSSNGTLTPLMTPSPFRWGVYHDPYSMEEQGYGTDFSPIGPQQQRRFGTSSIPHGPHWQEGFTPEGPHYGASGILGLDGDTLVEGQQNETTATGLRSTGKIPMDCSTSLYRAFEGAYCERESAPDIGTFDLDLSYVSHGLPSPSLPIFDFVQDTSTETYLSQTIAPQATIVQPDVVPLAPRHESESAFQTFKFESEHTTYRSPATGNASPFDVGAEIESPGERQELGDAIVHLSPGRTGRLRKDRDSPSKARSKPKFQTRSLRGVLLKDTPVTLEETDNVVHSTNLPYYCKECKRGFNRPEHLNRHKESIQHTKKSSYPWKCQVPACKAKDFGVSRKDNLKAHCMKTHFYDEEDKNRKRNPWVSPKDAMKMGYGEWDPRTVYGRKCLAQTKSVGNSPYKTKEEHD